MKNRKYKVDRDSIYVGEVARTDKIYRYEGETNLFRTKPGQLNTSGWYSYRSMLFVPDEEKLSSDLLYQSPAYPILNVTDDETCLGLGERSIVIRDACSLAALLDYFGYAKTLTYEDIMRIRKEFFSGRFAMDNCELFGWREVKPEDCTYYKNGVEITDPEELAKRIDQERRSQEEGHRSFFGIEGSVLPSEYFEVLDARGDNTIKEAILWREKTDAFAPSKQEGPIRKLRRF